MPFQIHDDSSNELLESQKQQSDDWLKDSAYPTDTPHHLTIFTNLEDVKFDSIPDTTKRYQTKMLLASLIEHFCSAYGDSPDANRKVFFLICQTLRSLGIMDAEFMDEMTRVRSAFQQAFHKLFYTAVQTVKNQDLLEFDSPRLIQDQSSSSLDYFSSKRPSSSLSDDHSTSSSSFSFIKSSMSDASICPEEFLNLSVQNSRYNTDFVELNLLGKGGFASAYRARNKLDGIDYAVKKIRLGSHIETDHHQDTNPYERIFREIKNLARLEHQNVIRYYSSWLEFDESPSVCDSDEDDMTETSQLPSFQSCSGMSQIQFGEGSTSHYDDNPTTASSSNDSNSIHSNSIYTNPSKSTMEGNRGWTLFIQMQLCPTTLHDYIRLRNRQDQTTLDALVESQRNLEIFAQILQGTAYIHQQGLIHRDLKPSNIFLYTTDKHKKTEVTIQSFTSVEESWVPKIGDFGLAAEAMDDDEGTPVLVPTPISSSPPSPQPNHHRRRPKPIRTRTMGVGTRTYASPEQLAEKIYDEKVDIYSLGIILFELFQPFGTGMERADALDKLKQGVFPNGFLELYPKISALILWMMHPQPTKRPSAEQLLQFEVFTTANETQHDLNTQMQATISQLERKNKELRQQLDQVEQEKEEMRQRMEAMQLKLDAMDTNQPKKKKEVRWVSCINK